MADKKDDDSEDSADYKRMYWKNLKSSKKVKISEDGNRIRLSVPKKTDLWRRTKFGFTLENAPYYFRRVKGNFMVSVKINVKFENLYDQAGILIRDSENMYVRVGLENFIPARRDAVKAKQYMLCATSAVTKHVTDWATMPLEYVKGPNDLKDCWFAVKRRGDCIEAYYSKDGEDYKQMRLAQLSNNLRLHVGLYGACPEGEGIKVVFEHLEIEELSDDEDEDWDEEDEDGDEDGDEEGEEGEFGSGDEDDGEGRGRRAAEYDDDEEPYDDEEPDDNDRDPQPQALLQAAGSDDSEDEPQYFEDDSDLD